MSFVNKLREKKWEFFIYGAVFAVFAAAMCICPAYYSMNDDVMMKSILSGAYTGVPDGHAVYMKYPLTGLLSMLYRLCRAVPWFELMLVGSLWLSASAVIVRTLKITRDRTDGIGRVMGVILCACLCLSLFVPHLLTLHYTLTAAAVGSCGLFLAVTGGGILWPVLLVLCFCIRSQIFYLLLPFLAVAVLYRLAGKDGWRIALKKEYLFRQLSAMAVGVILCMLIDGFMYRGEQWQEYREYNDSRTQLYDYDGLLPYEGNEELFEEAGISESSHRIMDEYVLVLDETIDADMMDRAAQLSASVREENESVKEKLIDCVKEYYYHIRYTDLPYNLLWIGAYMATGIVLLRKREFLRLALTVCLAGGRSLIWIYLIWQGRFPERVYVSLYFLEILLLAGFVTAALSEGKLSDKGGEKPARRSDKTAGGVLMPVLCALIGLLLVFSGMQQYSVMAGRAKEQAVRQDEWNALTAYCEENPDALYLLDVRSMVRYTGKVWQKTARKENFLLAGGWMSRTPLLTERLSDAEEMYYISGVKRDAGWLCEYLEERFPGRSPEKTDTINCSGEEVFDVWYPVK